MASANSASGSLRKEIRGRSPAVQLSACFTFCGSEKEKYQRLFSIALLEVVPVTSCVTCQVPLTSLRLYPGL
jgi:hypothetical protein